MSGAVASFPGALPLHRTRASLGQDGELGWVALTAEPGKRAVGGSQQGLHVCACSCARRGKHSLQHGLPCLCARQALGPGLISLLAANRGGMYTASVQKAADELKVGFVLLHVGSC